MNAMIRPRIHAALALALSGSAMLAGLAAAQVPSPAPAQGGEAVIYPAHGQSAQQQDMDRYQCHDWARGQSGFDPTRVTAPVTAMPAMPVAPATASPPSASKSADPTGGMAKGAIGGAAVGELANRDVGRAAAAGALGGGLLTKLKEQQTQQKQQASQAQFTAQQQQQQQQQAAQLAAVQQQQQAAARIAPRQTYDRAFAACMEGRGYALR